MPNSYDLDEYQTMFPVRDSERVRAVAAVVPVVGATGVTPRGIAGVGAKVATNITRAGSVKGGGLAATFPVTRNNQPLMMALTDQRMVVCGHDEKEPGVPKELVWECPRGAIARVERKMRTGIMARFRLHFVDGSSVALLTLFKGAITAFAEDLDS